MEVDNCETAKREEGHQDPLLNKYIEKEEDLKRVEWNGREILNDKLHII
jgi:hypothetical protein